MIGNRKEGGSVTESNGKFRGVVTNPLESTAASKSVRKHTPSVAPRVQAILDCAARQAKIDAEVEAHIQTLKKADRALDGLERAPDTNDPILNETPKQAYWHASGKTKYVRHRVMRKKSSGKGFAWVQACVECPTDAVAIPVRNGKANDTRHLCLGCGGGCPHNKQPSMCGSCVKDNTKSSHNCSNCGNIYLSYKRKVKQGGPGLCAGCEPQLALPPAPSSKSSSKKQKAAPRVKQYEDKTVFALLSNDYKESFEKGIAPRPVHFTREIYFDYRCVKGTKFEGDEKKCSYVDFVVNPQRGGKLIYLEVDEGMHKGSNYTISCDTARMWNVTTSTGFDVSKSGEDDYKINVNVLWLRMNPDVGFKIGNVTHRPDPDARCKAVCKLIDGIEGHEDDPKFAVCYCFYHMDANSNSIILADPGYNEMVKSGVRRVRHTISGDEIKLELV